MFFRQVKDRLCVIIKSVFLSSVACYYINARSYRTLLKKMKKIKNDSTLKSILFENQLCSRR